MGSSLSKPEFDTVLADKHVKIGQDIRLQCKANMEEITGIWEKNGQKLVCVDGKHTMERTGRSFTLTIKNAEEGDDGIYTLKLKNMRSECSSSATVTVEYNEWRTVQWNQDGMIDALKSFKISNEKIKKLNFLLCGPIGAGKSSIINTIKTIFEGHLFVNCLAAAEMTHSTTKYYEKNTIGRDGLLPFTFSDVKGIEMKDKEVHTQDIISILKGHMKDGYMFNSEMKLAENSKYYLENPKLNDKIHCLVNVIPADKISLMEQDVIQKINKVRDEATEMGLPQVIFMTRVDLVCPLTKKDQHNVYKSHKIKEKMHECSLLLGVPVNCIFPVYNYHKETDDKEEINCLTLYALTKIAHFANDYIVKCSNKQTAVED